ncbi:MAG: helix-turn-helix domain-containing protein [Victivallales bacterium]
MAGKENSDLFSQLSSNDGSLPLDFNKNTGVSDSSNRETDKKTETSESNPIESHPRIGKSEPQRRSTHHVPAPYKKTVQEAVPLEPKNNAETKSSVIFQDKPIEKPGIEPERDRGEVKPAAVTVEEVQVQTPVSGGIPIPEQVKVPVRAEASSATAPVVPVSDPIVQTPASPVAAQVGKSPEAASSSKRLRHPKAPHPSKTTDVERQVEPVVPVKDEPKSQSPDMNRQEIKSSNIPKYPASVNVKKEVTAPAAPVTPNRKSLPEQKISKAEPHKPAKKTGVTEKFSTDHATAGQLLQEGRVRAGLSIDQASISTKIKKTFIESLERDDFKDLPASVYVNAYTRALCSLYNIDGNLVFSLLDKMKGKNLDYTVPEEVIHQLEKGKQVNIVQENKVKRVIFIGFAACFTLVACILITYYFMHAGGKPSSSAATAQLKPSINPLPVKTGMTAGISAKTLEEDMEKKLMPPHVFTMTSLPLSER